VRGYQKKVIFLKNTGSHLFDEAYFVMSREGEEAAVDQSDMVFEANRIINESIGGRESRIGRERGGKKSFIIPFLIGALFSVALMTIIYSAVLLFK
jgi:hypothetical protein